MSPVNGYYTGDSKLAPQTCRSDRNPARYVSDFTLKPDHYTWGSFIDEDVHSLKLQSVEQYEIRAAAEEEEADRESRDIKIGNYRANPPVSSIYIFGFPH